MSGRTLTVLLWAAWGALAALRPALAQAVTNRADAVQAVCQRLGIGAGAVVADVGCGEGTDVMTFASVVGPGGTVLAEEIDTAKLKTVLQAAAQRRLYQVVPVLGESQDPRLPDGFVDLIWMHRVFHHLVYPQAMLKRMWQDLKQGGWLVIVDQQKGPPTDWPPMESREKKHQWTAETTVVRLAREAGFLFYDALDELWHEAQPFVLAFRKPPLPAQPAGDPDLPEPLDAPALLRALPLDPPERSVALFVGLDHGRAVAPVLRQRLPSSIRLFDVVLQEWAVSSEELPPGSPIPGVELLRMQKGNLPLPSDLQVGLVLFVDAYHRLWDPVPLLRQLHQHMLPAGRAVVLDRRGPKAEPRRLAGHRRRLASEVVTEDMRQAGFALRQTLAPPSPDRYLLVFEPKALAEEAKPRAEEELKR
jgi:SAM-dependent methyltransferase